MDRAGRGGTDLAATAAELTGRKVADPVTDRADAALARGLATTDAPLYFLPGELATGPGAPQDGVSATLRFPREAIG